MSATQATVTNKQVAVRYRRNVSSLSIDTLTNSRTTTLCRNIDQHIRQVLVNISTDAQQICRSIWQLTHLGQHIDQHSTDMSADILVNTQPICQPIHQSSDDQCEADLKSTKIHMIRPFYSCLLRPNDLTIKWKGGCW